MNKLIKKAASVICAAVLLSGCSSGSGITERPQNTHPEPVSTPSVSTAGKTESNPSASGEWLEDRGTMLNFTGSVFDIMRMGRENEVPMSNDGVWTVFVYMCATDLESSGGAGTRDLIEMENATEKCSNLRFVIEAGGTKMWDNSLCEDGKSQRLIIKDGYTTVLDSGRAKNMGSADTLADFVSWGVENYSSQYMVLDFWDHGGGSITGVCFDELYDLDSLSIAEIDTALASVFDKMTDRFELIGCDACLMATVEIANTFVPYGRYMVASQNLESFYGWDYGSFADAVNKGVTNGADMGRYIADGYYEFCTYTGEEDNATMSVIDLSKMDAFLKEFNSYSKKLYEYASNSGMTDVIKAAKKSKNFGGNNKAEGYTNMVDLLSFLDNTYQYVSDSTAEVMLMDDVVVYTNNGYYNGSAGGLNIYYPLSVQGSNELDIFRNICVSPYYLSLVDLCAYGSDNNGSNAGFNFDEWLNDNSGFWSSLFNWSNSSYDYWESDDNDNLNFDYSATAISFINEPHLTDDGAYSFRLTEESLYNLDTVYCNIMMSYWDEQDNCEYMLDLGTDDYVDLDWDTGECYDNFSGYWFALPDGQPLCVYLTEVFYDPDTEEYYNLYTAPIYINDKYTYLRIKQSYEYSGMTTEILGAWDGISESGSASRDLYQLEAGDRICPCYPAYSAETGEYVFDYYGADYVYTGNSLIDEEILYEGEYYYAFEIYDVYDNAVYTDFVLFGVDEDGLLYYYH